MGVSDKGNNDAASLGGWRSAHPLYFKWCESHLKVEKSRAYCTQEMAAANHTPDQKVLGIYAYVWFHLLPLFFSSSPSAYCMDPPASTAGLSVSVWWFICQSCLEACSQTHTELCLTDSLEMWWFGQADNQG